jgi:hypothetical protein
VARGAPTPQEWQWAEVEPGIGFSIPPDAQRGPGAPIDSVAGVFYGKGYAITFDLGRFGERLDSLASERSFRTGSREVGGRPAREVAFEPSDEPFAWARVIQVDVGAGRALTIRVSCDSPDQCSLADQVFDSVMID